MVERRSIKLKTGASFEHIPFKGSNAMIAALLSGQVTMTFVDTQPLVETGVPGIAVDGWNGAFEFTDDEVGVNGIPGYTRFRVLYEGARWIWSLNLVFDNVVIARKTVR